MPRPVAVLVGHDERGVRTRPRARSAAAVGYDARVPHHARAVEQPDVGGVDRPSPSPVTISEWRADSARTIGVGSVDRVDHDRIERSARWRARRDRSRLPRANRAAPSRGLRRRGRAEHGRLAEPGDRARTRDASSRGARGRSARTGCRCGATTAPTPMRRSSATTRRRVGRRPPGSGGRSRSAGRRCRACRTG